MRRPSTPSAGRCTSEDMTTTVYDKHAEFYVDFIDRGLASESGYTSLLLSILVECLGDRLSDARVCDLCCGEGYLSRYLLTRGAREVVGIDSSSALIEVARHRAPAAELSYRVDDAQMLRSVSDGEFDVVVSQMAMMDVADSRKMFAAVRRVLVTGGPFVFRCCIPALRVGRSMFETRRHTSWMRVGSRSHFQCGATPPRDPGIPEVTAFVVEWAPITASFRPTSTICSPAVSALNGSRNPWRAWTRRKLGCLRRFRRFSSSPRGPSSR